MSEPIFRIYETKEAMLIHNLLKSKVMSIDKTYLSLSAQQVDILNQSIILSVFKAFGILGLIQIGVCDFLIYVKSTEKVGNIGSTEIFEIKEIDFLIITPEINPKLSNEVLSVLNSLKKLFKEGFYYSHNYDLTNSLQNQKIIKINNNNRFDFIKDANKEFLWNNQLYTKFFDYNIDNDFFVNCICGYVGVISEKIDNSTMLNYILISRRSTQNAGINTFKKGVDKEGHVANYVESEQIIIVNQNVFSFVQIRGNPPVFYNKFQTLSNQRDFNPDSDPLPSLFERHLKYILDNKNFKLVFIMNLMNNLKEDEQCLTETYERLIQDKGFKFLKYSYFDIENEINKFTGSKTVINSNSQSNNSNSTGTNLDILDFFSQTNSRINISNNSIQEDPIDSFLKKIEGIFNIFKFFGIFYTLNQENSNKNLLEDIPKNENLNINNNSFSKVLYDQVGVFRINCHDALERSNIMQMRIGWKMLLIQLELIQLDGVSLFGNNFFDNNEGGENSNLNQNLLHLDEILGVSNELTNKLDLNNSQPKSKFLSNFKKLWGENGFKLSCQYTGVKSNNNSNSITTEEEGRTGYEDSFKQRSIDILLQKYDIKINTGKLKFNYIIYLNFNLSYIYIVNDELIKKELFNHIDEYTITEELTIFIGSWNVGGQNLKEEMGLYEWLLPKTKLQKTPDIYCVGLQEIVELNANYLLISSNQPRVDYWKNNIKKNLDSIDK